MEILKQGQYEPMTVAEQVVSVWSVTQGRLDDIPAEDVQRFEDEVQEYMQARHGDLLERLSTSKLDDELEEELASAVDTFKESFEPSEVVEEPEDEPVGWDAMTVKDDEDDEDDEDEQE